MSGQGQGKAAKTKALRQKNAGSALRGILFGSPVQPRFELISEDLEMRRSTRARRMSLRLDVKSRKIILTAPKRASMKSAYLFAWEHKNWIAESLAALPGPVPLAHGETIPVLGQKRLITVSYDPDWRRTDIELTATRLIVRTNKDDPAPRIRRYLKDLAKRELAALAQEKAACTGKKLRSVTVRDTISRWGSCSSDGNLSFSWRLIFAPQSAFDYVVAHEVAHLLHMDHSPRFWAACEALSTDYTRGKRWMKQRGSELMRYA